MTYFFSYDIADIHRRNQISKALEQFGFRVQKSVFHCDVSPELAEDIKSVLLTIINEKEDSLFFYPICADCLRKVSLIGNGEILRTETFEIL